MFKWLTSIFTKHENIESLINWSKNDPAKLSYWLESHIWYRADKNPKDNWEDLDKVFKRGSCDCEEMAGLFFKVMTAWNSKWTPQLLCVYTKTTGHAVCVFPWKKQLCYFDFNGIIKTRVKDINKIPKLIYEDFSYAGLVDFKGRTIDDGIILP